MAKKTQDTKLEPFLIRNGRKMPRCQALRTDGSGRQCTQAARKGMSVCHKHGGGTRKRVEEGAKAPVGRPPVHGLYSKGGITQIQDLLNEVWVLEQDLDNSDKELALLKATLWFLLGQADKFNGKVESLETILDGFMNRAAELGTMDEKALRELARDMAQGYRLISELRSWTLQLGDFAMKVITAIKNRAETKAKLAEVAALEHFLKLAVAVRDVIWEIIPDEDVLEVFETRMKREIFGPNRLEYPKRVTN